jgi:outer membrane receptor protein involved in Fe transport
LFRASLAGLPAESPVALFSRGLYGPVPLAVAGARAGLTGVKTALAYGTMDGHKLMVFGLLALAGALLAQPGPAAVITGRVFDATAQTPVEYANVVLVSLPESVQVNGAVTDKTGTFRIEGVGPGRYRVECSFIGYKNKTAKEFDVAAGEVCDLGKITLEQKPIAVPGVEATAVKPAVSFEVDRKVIDVTKLPNASSGTAVDALRNAPSVKVDIEDNVTLRGSSNFRVLIDGRPTQEDPSEALRQIPSATIQNIEIITNPSVKYEPDGTAGIINVVLRKQKGGGLSALGNGNVGLGGRYGGDALVGYRQGVLNSYAGGNYNRYVFKGSAVSDQWTWDGPETLQVTTTGSNNGGPHVGGARAGLDFGWGPSDKSSLSGRYRFFGTGGDNRSHVVERHAPADSTRVYGEDGGWRWNGRVFFVLADHEHGFDTTGHKLTARVSMAGRGSTSAGWSFAVDSVLDTTSGRRTEEEGSWRLITPELTYSKPRAFGGQLDAGYEGQLETNSGTRWPYVYDSAGHALVPDTMSGKAYTSREDIHAVYATWSWKWQKLGVQPGLRVEYDDRLIHVTDTDSTYLMRRWDWFPGLHLSYSLPANQQVTASYSRRIDRPGSWELAPLLTWWNSRTIGQGNPALRPQYTNSLEANYELPFGANSFNAGLYYRVTNDLYEQVTKRYDADSTVLLMTSANVGNDRSLGLELSAGYSPFSWLTLNPNADAYDYRVQGTLFGQPFSRGGYSWSAGLDLDFHFPTGTRVQASGGYSAPTATSQGEQGGWFDTSISARQSLLNRALNITLRVGNLLGLGKWHTVSEGDGFRTVSDYTGEPRVITLALSYNLNSFRADPKMHEGEGAEMQGGGQGR